MAVASLVGIEIEYGKRVLAALDEAGLNVKVALWMLTPEHEDGRIVLASPKFDEGSSLLGAYYLVTSAIPERFSVSMPPILLLRMKDPLIKALRGRFSSAIDVEGMRLGGSVIGNRFISDAYVYRIDQRLSPR